MICFRPGLNLFVCGDETRLDVTFRYLFERIDTYMKLDFPGRMAKLIFDNRDHQTHEANARAITNFFVRSTVGLGYDSVLRVPFFAVSQGHNYGIQFADLIATTIAIYFQGWREYRPLWKIVQQMLYSASVGGQTQTSLKVMRNSQGYPGRAHKKQPPDLITEILGPTTSTSPENRPFSAGKGIQRSRDFSN